MEKIKSWDRLKICDGRGEGAEAQISIRVYSLALMPTFGGFRMNLDYIYQTLTEPLSIPHWVTHPLSISRNAHTFSLAMLTIVCHTFTNNLFVNIFFVTNFLSQILFFVTIFFFAMVFTIFLATFFFSHFFSSDIFISHFFVTHYFHRTFCLIFFSRHIFSSSFVVTNFVLDGSGINQVPWFSFKISPNLTAQSNPN